MALPKFSRLVAASGHGRATRRSERTYVTVKTRLSLTRYEIELRTLLNTTS